MFQCTGSYDVVGNIARCIILSRFTLKKKSGKKQFFVIFTRLIIYIDVHAKSIRDVLPKWNGNAHTDRFPFEYELLHNICIVIRYAVCWVTFIIIIIIIIIITPQSFTYEYLLSAECTQRAPVKWCFLKTILRVIARDRH